LSRRAEFRVDLCYRNPGFDVDLFVEASLRALTQVWLGHVSIDQATRDGRLRLDGSRAGINAFRSWFALSMFAPAGREPIGQTGPQLSKTRRAPGNHVILTRERFFQ
jgi:hypothetical protein